MNEKTINPAESTKDTVVAEKTSIVSEDRKANYLQTRAASGAKSLNNGDPTAVALAGLTLEQVYVLSDNLLNLEEDLRKKYAHLNQGMQRMVVGNRIRAAVKSEKDGTPTIEQLEKAVAPMQKANAAAAAKAEKEKAEKEKAAAAAKAEKEKAAKAEKEKAAAAAKAKSTDKTKEKAAK